MLPETAADGLRRSIPAPYGAVSVWPWHEDDGRIVMIVKLGPNQQVNARDIPSSYRGFEVRVEYSRFPVVT